MTTRSVAHSSCCIFHNFAHEFNRNKRTCVGISRSADRVRKQKRTEQEARHRTMKTRNKPKQVSCNSSRNSITRLGVSGSGGALAQAGFAIIACSTTRTFTIGEGRDVIHARRPRNDNCTYFLVKPNAIIVTFSF